MVVVLLTIFMLSCSVGATAACNPLDRDSLLALSLNISAPASSPLDWNSSVDCCLWEGILCVDTTKHGNPRVTQIWLPARGLRGIISPSITSLTQLSDLNLSRNSLTGSIPSGFFSSLDRLQVLDLSYNRLGGEFPSSSAYSNGALQTVDISSNNFYGTIPPSFLDQAVTAGALISFNVSHNSFTGPIPVSSLCTNNSSRNSVRFLDFSYNVFTGQIASGLGLCSTLEIFRAGFNDLWGPIPSDIYDAVALVELSVPANQLTGTIEDGVVRLTNLEVLELYSNNLDGLIPRDIGKLSNLESLLLHINNLTGSLPPSLSNCANLTTLILRVNQFNGDLSVFDFSNLVNLTTLDIGNNRFHGSIPKSFYSCKKLRAVRMSTNQLTGEILPDVIALQSLSFISVSNNTLTNITGALRNLMGCRNLTTLIVSKNFYDEALPYDDNAVDPEAFLKVQILSLGACRFKGKVPNWISRLMRVEVLDLSVNNLTGSIPPWVGSLPMLFYADLSFNSFTGGFPVELCKLPALSSPQAYDQGVKQTYLELPVFVQPNNATDQQYNQLANLFPAIYVNNNNLSGNIPFQIGQLTVLHVLDFSDNNFSGNIPVELSDLTNLEILDLSGNHLSGEIPSSLKGLHFLSWFSVANNDLQGPVPSGGQFDTFPATSFEGNPGLCGAILRRSCASQQTIETHQGSKKRLVIGVVLILFGTGFVITVLALWILSKRRVTPREDTDKIDLESISSNSNPLVPPEFDKDTSMVVLFPNNPNKIKDLTISEILKATDNFSQANIVGCGGFGLVYKATLVDGSNLAVKKLSGDLGLMEREFKAEVEALSTAQHKNLVTLQGYCMHEGSRLLLYSYMENGSLDYWLHEKVDGASEIDWPIRLKILRGTSRGVAYMHLVCEPHIVHRDIKSSNILLDDKFEAHVADFGLSRLINPYQTHVTTELVGTLGYIPPEYGQSWVATLRGDVYSFGVVMLELLTGKRPMEVLKPKVSRDLVSWVQQMRSEGKQEQIFDPFLKGRGFEEELLEVLDVACMCVNQNPVKRPTIQEIVDWLKNVGPSLREQNKD